MKLVLDSSVVAKLFFDEPSSDFAIKLMFLGDEEDIEFYASDLVIYEVGNAIWKNLRKKKKDGGQYINLIFQLNINFVSVDDELADLAMKEAQKKDITYYDGVHIALSKREQTTLVTQDKELLKKYKTTSSIEKIVRNLRK